MHDLIRVQNLRFSYSPSNGDTLFIPEFQLKKGETVFLYGPSGFGKTTFLEILAGVLHSSQGQVHILGQDLCQMSAKARDQFRGEHLGYIFQSFNLIPYLNVRENIELPLQLCPQRRARVAEQNAENFLHEICERLGLLPVLDRRVTELSMGQQQRVAVARALTGKPELILADEPTSALDMDHREKFLNLLFELCSSCGTSVLFVSHDRSIEHLFSRVLALDEINKVRG